MSKSCGLGGLGTRTHRTRPHHSRPGSVSNKNKSRVKWKTIVVTANKTGRFQNQSGTILMMHRNSTQIKIFFYKCRGRRSIDGVNHRGQPPFLLDLQQLESEPKIRCSNRSASSNCGQSLLKRHLLCPHNVRDDNRCAATDALDTVNHDMTSPEDSLMDPDQGLVQDICDSLFLGVFQIPGQQLQAAIMRQRLTNRPSTIDNVSDTKIVQLLYGTTNFARRDTHTGQYS
mmetsp:Transcript_19696/g.49903  ORF Transcript_19696/g.49903 Transcript_19696/m.49903 type:complete len:229 (-) Transcript_19696:644-1330(-)